MQELSGDKTSRACWSLMGLPFDQVDSGQAVEIIDRAIKARRKCFLSTPNLNFIVQAKRDQSFFQSVLFSDLVVADGMPVIWTARLLGIPLKSRVAGSSLFEILQNTRRDKPISVFFFGGQGTAARDAAENLNRKSVGMIACGALNPGTGSVESMSSDEIIGLINRAEPDFLVVALGAKKGQQWIMRNRERLNALVISHLGAVVNFVGDSVQRAPLRWQQLGLEWLWRIVQEPLLWKRYFFDGLWFLRFMVSHVLPLAIYQKCLRRTASEGLSLDMVTDRGDGMCLVLAGSATVADGALLKSSCLRLLDELQPGTSVSVDCANLDYIDSSALGTLMLLKANILRRGGGFELCHLNTRIKRLVHLHGADEFLLE